MFAPLVLTGTALLFALQLLLLAKARRTAVRLIPVYLVCALFAYAAATYLGMLGTYDATDSVTNELVGTALFMISGVEAVGPVLAWAVYGAALLVRKKKGSTS